MGLNFRFADVFANIQEDKVNYLVSQLCTKSYFTKNMIKVMRVKGEANEICIKTISKFRRIILFYE
ncbi:MAG: hypothetical protein DA329_11225 [Candidatus Nitrosocosmicus sp.]|nr:hypothetical protein [Candidatus Nitrosocosmicus sp.]